jgi:hypothetical protein
MSRILLFILLLPFFSCNKKCNCYETNHYINKAKQEPDIYQIHAIKYKFIDSLKSSDPYFGRQLVTIDNKNYFAGLIRKRGITMYGIENSDSFRIIPVDTLLRLFPTNGYNIIIRNDSIHLINILKKQYYCIKITFKGLTILDSIDLKPLLPRSTSYIYTKIIEPTLEFNFPFLYIYFGDSKRKNFIDDKAYLKLNIVQKNLNKIIPYPSCYKCSFIYEATSSIAVFSDNTTVTLFDKYDELYKRDSSDKEMGSTYIDHDCHFVVFEESKEKNLAFVRKELTRGERNVKIINIRDKYLMVVKRDQKKMDEPDKFSIFIFDKNLNQLTSAKIEHPQNSVSIFQYKNGVIMFADEKSTAYFYEFN